MARKRIKTLAQEWNVPVADVIHSCERLKLAHGRLDSSLLTGEEADRVKADLGEQANRAAILRHEVVLETTSGKVVEKRLNETIMRRRHAEPDAIAADTALPPAGEPFVFEVEQGRGDDFVAPFLDEQPTPEPEVPIVLETAPASPEPNFEPEPSPPPQPAAEPQHADGMPAAAAVSAQVSAEAASVQPSAEAPSDAAPAQDAAAAEMPAAEQVAQPAAAPPQTETRPVPPRVEEPRRGAGMSATKPVVVERSRPIQPSAPAASAKEAPKITRPPGSPTVISLARGHAAAPSLDDQQQGPKVLGKIDLRKPAARPASSTPARPTGALARPGGVVTRPGQPLRTGRPAPGPMEAPPMPPPGGQVPAKPGARPIKKKRVVKKEGGDLLTEREMRGARFPKKRRALPGKEQKKTEITTPKASKRVVRISEGVTVADLARNMGVKAAEVIKKLMVLGLMSTVNQVLDVDTATLVASEFGYNVENVAFDVEAAIEAGGAEEVANGELVPRPPVVTVMGHVDHGKTSLLDAIRHTDVTAEEFGGITQHIGAYTVEVDGRPITFVDTPGHEAFTSMRARGAKVTDIVILVVAADEGVMPQTVEALNHARAAKVPIIVAINKIDRPEANLERVKQQLSENGLIPEDYGGDTITVGVSARTREGLDRLLEMILLQAEILDLKANPNRLARGTVIESELDRGRGAVATVLVQEGTLHQGDAFVAGTVYGRVRAMLNHLGQRVNEAGPAMPVEIFGLSGVPDPGTVLVAVADESKGRQVAEFRQAKEREGELQKTSRVSLEDLSQRMRAGEIKELKVIVKGDVQGSVEALSAYLRRLSTAEVKVDVIHASAGGISETDVSLAAASGAIIIGFNVRPEQKAAALAESESVDIRLYTVIYDAINEMREAMEGMLAPTYREKSLGRAEVRQVFNVSGGTVAGSMVQDGKINRGSRVRLVRDSRVVWEGKVGSLRRFKDDVREVASGYECGIALENYGDVKPGDIIEAFELEAVSRKLGMPTPEPMPSEMAAEKQL
ncbi:MAG TPA: translation initiation factor IF-2 [Candidatus Binataceae bacterium]|nr:translation initiation factor IF-2 [Candidatus Binataceae bacterium]